MATRLPDPADASATPATPPASQPAVDELSVLLPDMPLVIAGRSLVVREYRFGESLEVAVLAAPLIADIAATIATTAPRYDQVRPLFARHRALVMQLVAKSADVEPEWIASLGRAEGELLVNTWFTVNCGFFVHEAGVLTLEAQRHAAAQAGVSSSPPSLQPGTAESSSSAATPSAS